MTNFTGLGDIGVMGLNDSLFWYPSHGLCKQIVSPGYFFPCFNTDCEKKRCEENAQPFISRSKTPQLGFYSRELIPEAFLYLCRTLT